MKLKLPTFECVRCGHRWHPQKAEVPVCCAFCKSPYWKRPTEILPEVLARHREECEACKRHD